VLQPSPGDQLPVLWAEYDRLQELISALRRLQGPVPAKPARSSILPVFEKWALENKAIYKEVIILCSLLIMIEKNTVEKWGIYKVAQFCKDGNV